MFESNEKNSTDISRTSNDVLRSGDIVPPFDKARDSAEEPEITEIPQFDLANDIMAEQRKISSSKRKSLAKKTGKQNHVEEISIEENAAEQTWANQPEQDRLIAEIVARDIERLRQGVI